MFKNAAKTARQYASGMMSTDARAEYDRQYQKYIDAAVKAMADKIDQEAMRVYAGISEREAAVAHLPTEEAKQAARRLLDAAFGSSPVPTVGVDWTFDTNVVRAGQRYDTRPWR